MNRLTLAILTGWTVTVGALGASLAVTGCPPPTPPAPVPPDADAAPTPAQDASAPTVPCQAACDALSRLCGAQLDDCVPTWAHIESAKLLRNARTGQPLTCADVAAAGSVADVQALGVACAP